MELDSKARYRLEEVPPPPKTLSPSAREHWLNLLPIIVELGTARNCDIEGLTLMVEARADLDLIQASLRMDSPARHPRAP